MAFDDLSIDFGTGNLSSTAVLKVSSTSEVLAVLPGINPAFLQATDSI
ncbi:MAG: hypothetical protein J7641_20245 [Cyanobacteria bacterium SID2]|nr:hypothetical protein [Cyanobacteria bacterium SID2]MBP0005173.1 hypothetical protein [Cyanobacteria bacterium SBC]